ncbi:MAG TPA: amidohydrolase family protein, partial [Burkholderiaceae bacterium]
MDRLALFGDLLDFTGVPGLAQTDLHGVRWRPDHWLLVEDGRIVGARAQEPDASWRRERHPGRIVMPGFVDTHVHSPQLDVIASYGTELLDWLETYTFPAERAYADPGLAAAGSARFLDALLAHGKTAAVVFPTVHKVSADALFAAAAERGMRIVSGKCLMDRHAPDGLRDDVAGAERDCLELIERWHGRGRAAYALTVRFAPTSTPAQLAMAGRLAAADPTLYLQTHVAENRAEVRWVAELFPESRSYLEVYA